MQGNDRSNINSQLDQGRSVQGQIELAVNITREYYASSIGHHPTLAYQGIAENESIGRERYNILQKFVSVGRAIGEASRLTGTIHNNMSDDSDTEIPETESNISDSDTDTSDSNTGTSKILFDAILSQQVLPNPSQKAEALLVDQEEHENMPGASYTDPVHIPDTSDPDTDTSDSNTDTSQQVLSSPSQKAEALPFDQEELSDPSITVSATGPYHENMPSTSDTGPYHENMPGTSYTDPVHIPDTSDPDTDTSDSNTDTSQQVLSSPSQKAEALPVDQEELIDPSITVSATGPYQEIMPGTSHTGTSDTGPYHENMADTSDTGPNHENMPGTSDTVSDTPASQTVWSSASRTENASPVRPPSREG